MQFLQTLWDKYRDPALSIILVACLAGAAMELGRFGIQLLKWPLVVALFAGVAFAIANDGFHALKRVVRDKVWPWLRDMASYIMARLMQ